MHTGRMSSPSAIVYFASADINNPGRLLARLYSSAGARCYSYTSYAVTTSWCPPFLAQESVVYLWCTAIARTATVQQIRSPGVVSIGSRLMATNRRQTAVLIHVQPQPCSAPPPAQPKNISYNFSQRTHNLTDFSAIIKRNFVCRMLFRDIY